MKLLMTIILTAFLVISCGGGRKTSSKKNSSNTPTNSAGGTNPASTSQGGSGNSSYGYQFGDGFCTTGEKSFNTLEAMCAALIDERQNNNCLRPVRLDYHYNQGCPNTPLI